MRFWAKQVIVALDQLVNAIHGGWADETISSRAYRLKHRWPYKAYRFLIDLLFFWTPGHCEAAYVSELNRAHLPPEMRDDKALH